MFLGIDLGTSSAKLTIINDDLSIFDDFTATYPISYPREGWAEQNADDWWAAIKEALIVLCNRYPNIQIKGIGVAGQMHGLVVLDADGNPIRPVILWNDTRTQEETLYLNQVIGTKHLIEETGNIAFAGFTAPKLLWLKKHEPENFAKIKKILLPKDYIVYKLTGVFSTDLSDASGTLLFNVRTNQWSAKMCSICNIKLEQLPKLYISGEVVGYLSSKLKAKLGLNGNVLVIAGAGDNAAAAIAMGVLREGQCNISLGTSGTIFIPTNSFTQESTAALHSFADSTGRFHLMGCTLSAASCYKWLLDNIVKGVKSDLSINDEYKHNSLYFMPYLMGERSPLNDETVRAAFIGISARTNWQHMIYSVYEGVAFSIKDCFEVAKNMGIKVNTSSIVGGGSTSDIWCQIISNVLNIPIERYKKVRGPGFGVAMLAKAAYDNINISDLKIKNDDIQIFYPQLNEIDYYAYKYDKFRQLYPLLKEFYKK